jgi:hypothetical protein
MHSIYSELAGELVLDNEHVLVQRLLLPAGRSTGRPVHGGRQLQVFIKGGVLAPASGGRSALWKAGRVRWHEAAEAAGPGWTNTGEAPIEMVWVGIKPGPAARLPGGAGHHRAKAAHLDYPLIPGEDLLENEWLIVQRFLVMPGQWEGIHAHRPNTLYIHITGGRWSARSHTEPEHEYEQPAVDGEVGWMPAIDIGAGHESGNTGSAPIDILWVSLKT